MKEYWIRLKPGNFQTYADETLDAVFCRFRQDSLVGYAFLVTDSGRAMAVLNRVLAREGPVDFITRTRSGKAFTFYYARQRYHVQIKAAKLPGTWQYVSDASKEIIPPSFLEIRFMLDTAEDPEEIADLSSIYPQDSLLCQQDFHWQNLPINWVPTLFPLVSQAKAKGVEVQVDSSWILSRLQKLVLHGAENRLEVFTQPSVPPVVIPFGPPRPGSPQGPGWPDCFNGSNTLSRDANGRLVVDVSLEGSWLKVCRVYFRKAD